VDWNHTSRILIRVSVLSFVCIVFFIEIILFNNEKFALTATVALIEKGQNDLWQCGAVFGESVLGICHIVHWNRQTGAAPWKVNLSM